MDAERFANLTPEQRRWLEDDERLWVKAYRIVETRPELDVSGVYHVLRNLRRTPRRNAFDEA